MSAAVRVGFVGIGHMGRPMARNLLRGGYVLHVFDADFAKAARFAGELGGSAAPDLAGLGRDSDLVVTMLPTGGDVRDVLMGGVGADAVLAGGAGAALAASLAPGAVVVDMSSSDPLGTRELGARLKDKGIALIDAPVSGLVTRAESGTLTIMIGADDEDALRIARPVLECLGEKLVRCGSLGCGHAMKALNNVVGAAAFTVTAEALLVGRRFGLDPAVMTEVLSASTGRSFHSAMTFPEHVLTRRFASGFALGLLAKDVGIAADLGAALEMQTPVIDLVRRLFTEGRDEVGAGEDNSAIVKRWERINQVILEAGSKE